MSGHTPGPWSIRHKTAWLQVESEKWVVCNVGATPRANITDLMPDARLIAAAPDLLEALKRYVEHDDTGYNPAETFGRQIKDEALAAIAKAEGK